MSTLVISLGNMLRATLHYGQGHDHEIVGALDTRMKAIEIDCWVVTCFQV